MKYLVLSLLLFSFGIILKAQNANVIVKDIDGNEYKTFLSRPGTWLYNNRWMSENLRTSKFRNGDPIKECNDIKEWIAANAAKEPAFCYFNFDKTNNEKYGKLYNWYAVSDPRGIAPEGWRLPKPSDFSKLFYEKPYETGRKYSGDVTSYIMSEEGWDEPCSGADNASGFTALAGGGMKYFESKKDYFWGIEGKEAYFWVPSSFSPTERFALYLMSKPAVTERKRVKYETEDGETDYRYEREIIEEGICSISYLSKNTTESDAFYLRCISEEEFSPKSDIITELNLTVAVSISGTTTLNNIGKTAQDSLLMLYGEVGGQPAFGVYNTLNGNFFSSLANTQNSSRGFRNSTALGKETVMLWGDDVVTVYQLLNRKIIGHYDMSKSNARVIGSGTSGKYGLVVLFDKVKGNVEINSVNPTDGKVLKFIEVCKVDITKLSPVYAFCSSGNLDILFKSPDGNHQAIRYALTVSETQLNAVEKRKNTFNHPFPENITAADYRSGVLQIWALNDDKNGSYVYQLSFGGSTVIATPSTAGSQRIPVKTQDLVYLKGINFAVGEKAVFIEKNLKQKDGKEMAVFHKIGLNGDLETKMLEIKSGNSTDMSKYKFLRPLGGVQLGSKSYLFSLWKEKSENGGIKVMFSLF
jgi:uncharacterized protein (TIGR02145 family)